jgi:hypothetical protein
MLFCSILQTSFVDPLARSCAPGRILPTGITDAGYKLITDH